MYFSYVSEPPKDICLYEYQYISNVVGGERLRKTEEKFISSKQVFLYHILCLDFVLMCKGEI
jgi:hypothetical protein